MTQRALLDALWQVLEPGGTLLYVTCSVFRGENAEVVDGFLSGREDARRLPTTGLPSADGRLLPDASHDGFYYALLGKRVS